MATSSNKPISAFPKSAFFDQDPGMTLRDWFAGQALVGMSGSLLALGIADRGASIYVANRAYELANMMLEAKRNSEAADGQ